jgi:hypothetical protein
VVNPVAATDGGPHRWHIPKIAVDLLNIQTVERRVVAPAPEEGAHGMSVPEKAPDKIGAEVTACSRNQ